MNLNETPSANRIQIGFFGKRNSGKSSLINAVVGQNVAIVSNIKGTTTDPIFKNMEINGLGACTIIDTAGFDDFGLLGEKRVEKTKLITERTDIAVLLFCDNDIEQENEWFNLFKNRNVPIICVISKADTNADIDTLTNLIKSKFNKEPIILSAFDKHSIEVLRNELIRSIPEDFEKESITGNLVQSSDTVLLVMPQDIQAPKGRLILPQVQTIRELLDKKCIVMSVTTDKIDEALKVLNKPPKLIITDSQVFKIVYEKKPKESLLTSFSVLFAGYKGDIDYYVKSANAIDLLNDNSKVLIAECCTHAPLSEDIGREKLPNMLRKKCGENIQFDIVGGADFPEDLSKYDLVIQCGACMYNRKFAISRINKAKVQKIPMTNYGVAIAYLTGILDKICTTIN